MFKGFILSIVAIMAFLSVAAVGQTARLQGVVDDQNKAAVSGAVVILRNVRTGEERTAVTNAEGAFAFDLTGDAAAYEVTVSARGFGSSTRQLTAADTSLSISLAPGPVSAEVTVTATRTQILTSETAVAVSVLDREEIDRKLVNTVGDLFRTLPGTSTVNEGGFQVRPRIRGLDSNRVLILVDGERLNNSRTSTAQSGIETGIVDISQVETVEIARGSGSVLYGTDALAGTINIITKDTPGRRDSGFRFGGAFDGFYSSNENGRRGTLSVNGSGRYFAFRASQSLERFGNYSTGKSDGVVPQSILAIGGITPDGEVLNSQSHAGNTQLATRFFLNDANTLKLNYERRRGADIGSPSLVGTFNAFFPFSNRDKFSGRYDVAQLTDNLQRLSISGFYQRQERNFTNILRVNPVFPFFPGLYQTSETVTDTKTTGFDLQSDWRLGDRNTLTAGFSFFKDDNSDRRQVVTSTTPTSTNRTISNTRSVPDAKLSNFAAFAQDEFRVTNRLKFVGGIRFDTFKTTSEPTTGFSLPMLRADQIRDLGIASLAAGLNTRVNAVTGDIGVVYRLTDNVNVSSRIGRSFRTPNIFEQFFTDAGSVGGFIVGNPNLKPESGRNFDVSVKVRKERLTASATYFHNAYRNFLNTVNANDSRGCPVFITQPGTVYDANNCSIVSFPPGRTPVRVLQTQNVDRARIHGFEAEVESPFRISFGYLTPYANLSYLRGDDTGRDVPLDIISPLRTNIGFRWNNFGKAYYFDYNARIVNTQRRLSPAFLRPVNQGGNGGPEAGYVTHNVAGGYHFDRERYRFSVNLGVSNFLNRAYNEQFVYAPARGRSFTIGTTLTLK
jgi:outer membrane receptor protein involved in Fe transport